MVLALIILGVYLSLGMAFKEATKHWAQETFTEHDIEPGLQKFMYGLLVVFWLPFGLSILYLAVKDWRSSVKDET